MANKRSALKAHRVSEKRHARNRAVISAVRTYVKKARIGMQGGAGEEAAAAVAEAAKMLDQAASKGVIHRNQAARRKSRLMSHLAALTRLDGAGAPAPQKAARRRATAGTARTTTRRSSSTPRTRTPRSSAPK